MPLTLSDEQVAQLRAQQAEAQRNREIAEFVNQIWNDPALSDEAKALAKKKFPDVQIPDFDLKRYVDGQFKSRDDERNKREREAAEKEATDRYTKQRSDIQKQYAATDEAMERMEKEMNDKRVYDYEVMAQHFFAKEPKPIENTTGGHYWNHHKQDVFKNIVADPEDYAFNEIARAVEADDQMRRGRR
jgi:hypothetical protein